jgi:hypothetical protein
MALALSANHFHAHGRWAHVFAMETVMFSLNFDPLFLGLDKARAAARLLNANWKRPAPAADPRELKRIADELRLARERVRMEVTRGRLFW